LSRRHAAAEQPGRALPPPQLPAAPGLQRPVRVPARVQRPRQGRPGEKAPRPARPPSFAPPQGRRAQEHALQVRVHRAH